MTGTLVVEMYFCSGCGEEKGRDEFYWRTSGKRDHLCKTHRKAKTAEDKKRWRQENPEAAKERDARYHAKTRERNPTYARNYHLQRNYSITLEQYEAMLAAQGGVCAICKGEDPKTASGSFNVDHDHACCSGKTSCGECVRGLLCTTCNVNLRALEQWTDEDIQTAREYLR